MPQRSAAFNLIIINMQPDKHVLIQSLQPSGGREYSQRPSIQLYAIYLLIFRVQLWMLLGWVIRVVLFAPQELTSLFTVAFDHDFGTMDNADNALGQAFVNLLQVPSLALHPGMHLSVDVDSMSSGCQRRANFLRKLSSVICHSPSANI